jgi:hypothetical protein
VMQRQPAIPETVDAPVYAFQTAQAPGTLQTVGGQWATDPAARHQYRWWSGTAWTEHVSDGGATSIDFL